MFIDSMPEHRESWEKWSDSFFLELLDKSLNDLPTSLKPLFEISEQEINSWLEQPNFKEEKQQRHKIRIPPVEEFCKKMQSTEKSDVINLPLTLEDNSTLTGTAAILDVFAKEFEDTHDKFDSLYKKVLNMVQQTVASGDEASLDKIVLDLSKKQKELDKSRDKFELYFMQQ